MKHLKQLCVQQTLQSLTSRNVCKMVGMVALYNDEALNEGVRKFLVDNLRDIEGTEEFEALQKEKPHFLIGVLMEAMLNKHLPRAAEGTDWTNISTGYFSLFGGKLYL